MQGQAQPAGLPTLRVHRAVPDVRWDAMVSPVANLLRPHVPLVACGEDHDMDMRSNWAPSLEKGCSTQEPSLMYSDATLDWRGSWPSTWDNHAYKAPAVRG